MTDTPRGTKPPEQGLDALYEKLARDAARLMLVHEAGRILRSTHNPEKLASELLHVVADAVFSSTGCVASLKDGELEMLATYGLTDTQADALVSDSAEAARWYAVADGAEPRRADDLARAVPGGMPMLAVYVPLWLEDKVLGVLALGPRVDGEAFTPADEEFVVSLASHLALALSSAQMATERERRIEQLNVLLKISKEITSTLDLERVLATIAQFVGMVVPNRRACVALVRSGAPTLEACSDPKFNMKTSQADPLLPILRWALAAHVKVNTCISQLAADPKAEGREHLMALLDAHKGPRGLAVLTLEDDQGALGLLTIEADADAPPLDGEKEELVAILANQTTVAVRNAELYQRVPMIGVLEPILKKARALAFGSRAWWTRTLAWGFAAVGLLVPLPATVAGDAAVLPAVPVAVRASTAGVVDEVLVVEGQRVEPGAVLARLRRDELSVNLEQARAETERAQAEAGRAMERGELADYRAAQARLEGLRGREAFLARELERAVLVAPSAGIVLTPRVELLKGERLLRGDTFAELADLSRMQIDVAVKEEDVGGVRPGSRARLKVYAYPGRTFSGTVLRVAPRADEKRRFRVSIGIDNRDGALRPGMTGRAQVEVPWRPFLWPYLLPFVRWFRFTFWV